MYLDAAFFPCLRELDFWQEGWRLEHENPSDPKTALVFKGVVFNEMKGAFVSFFPFYIVLMKASDSVKYGNISRYENN